VPDEIAVQTPMLIHSGPVALAERGRERAPNGGRACGRGRPSQGKKVTSTEDAVHGGKKGGR
jgi:hypothetical protein